MNINSKKPQPFCMEQSCPRKSFATVKMDRTGAKVRLCKAHFDQTFKKTKPPAQA